MEPFTPKAVFDLYALLSNDDKKTFLKLVGSHSTAEVPFLISHELPLPELERFTDMIHRELIWRVFPLMQREARRLAREKPDISDEELDKELHERIQHFMEEYDRTIGERERAKLKEQRDRKSDPETVRRNVEICDLRRKNQAFWSLGRLAKKYKRTKRAIQKILEDESKWRRLAASQGGPTS